MIDYGPPVRLKPGKGGVVKIRRGGPASGGNNFTPTRLRCRIRANRNFKKPSKSGIGEFQQMPWPPRGAPLWDPRDPISVAYRAAHPVETAAWRSRIGSKTNDSRTA